MGTLELGEALRPAEQLARRGFVVDETFAEQTADNAERFADFPATRALFLPAGAPPEVGDRFRNPGLARTYHELGHLGVEAFYQGELGHDIVRTVRQPPVDPAAARTVRPGAMTPADLAGYTAPLREPTAVAYRGLDVYGMAPPSSGGTTVGEALNILEGTDLATAHSTEYLHRFLEASKLSFADRNRYVGDPAFSDVPTAELLSPEFADSRGCLIRPDSALPAPQPPGDTRDPQPCAVAGAPAAAASKGPGTTHLAVADQWGNVVSYTLTIEQTGGSGMVVPGRGFLLNNELTDFSFTPVTPGVPDPNLPGPGKRPRSSMAPTIVLDKGVPVLTIGSPGGAMIITTVLQVLTGHLDRGVSLVDAIAAPRASQRNMISTQAEPTFLATTERAELEALGHTFTETPEIGAAAGVQQLPDGRWLAAAEPARRGGGSAMVVQPHG